MRLYVIIYTAAVFCAALWLNKSSLAYAQKKNLFIGALALLAPLVLMQKMQAVNQETQMVAAKPAVYRLPVPNNIQITLRYNISEVDDALNRFRNLKGVQLDPKSPSFEGPGFFALIGPPSSGKTTSVLQYAKILMQRSNSTVLYVDLANKTDESNLKLLLLQHQHRLFLQFVQSCNAQSVIPTIIFDHFEIFQKPGLCTLCATLPHLYLENKVNIVLISSSPRTKTLLEEEKMLKYIHLEYFKRSAASLLEMFKRITASLNGTFSQSQISVKQLERCQQLAEFRFDNIQNFIEKGQTATTYLDYCHQKIVAVAESLTDWKPYEQVLAYLVDLSQNKSSGVFENQWVYFQMLYQKLPWNEFEQFVKKVVDIPFLEAETDRVRFYSKIHYAASIYKYKGVSLSSLQIVFD